MSIIGFILPFVSVILTVLGFKLPIENFSMYALAAVVVLSMLGIIFSSIGCKKGKHRGLAIAGIVLNVLLFIAALLLVVALSIFIAACSAIFQGIGDGLGGGDSEGAIFLPALTF